MISSTTLAAGFLSNLRSPVTSLGDLGALVDADLDADVDLDADLDAGVDFDLA